MENTHDTAEKLRQLFEKEHWSEEDRRWLLQYLDTNDQSALRHLMQERFMQDAAHNGTHADAPRLLTSIHNRILPELPVIRHTPFIHRFKKLSVAAALLLVAGTGVWLYYRFRPAPAVAHTHTTAPADVPPGKNAATLTLADGSNITLDNAANGGLAQQGNMQVLKQDGQIVYAHNGAAAANAANMFNTIATARGNQYKLALSDGSKVWLNAASSIRFPAAFTGKERRVEITGEVYFEIAANAKMPFVVQVNGAEVQVLGTHFNVNAYPDEKELKTTLLEGAVAVKKANASQLLAPGQQARLNAAGSITLAKNIDAGSEIAWKDGFFWFNNTDIYSLMRQVSRWYDVQVEFKGSFSDDGFTGKIPRDVPLSQLLHVLELNDIQCTIEGKKITVLPSTL